MGKRQEENDLRFDFAYFLSALGDLAKYLPLTVALAITSMLASVVIGALFNVLLSVQKRWLTAIIQVYTSFFRGTPLLVQLFILYFVHGFLV